MLDSRIFKTDNTPGTVIIRLMVGGVFVSEGIQKFLFADQLGAGRFERIGLPMPEVLGPFVGATEILCGALVLAGAATRLAALPLIAIMLVAIGTTKLEILRNEGFWAMLHAGRTDWSMLLGSLFLSLYGGGRWSVDRSRTAG
jgi:putative oxidoreductase